MNIKENIMLNMFKTDAAETLQKELLKNYLDEKKIQKLINSGVDINFRDENDRTLLFDLAKKRKVESIKILIKNGVNVNAEDRYGKTVLTEAINKEDGMMIRFLLDNGASINFVNESGRTVLQDVALEGNARVFRILLAHNPDLDIKDSYGRTVLFDAVEGGNFDIVRDLINHVDNPNIADQNGQTVLYNAALNENQELAKFLISNGLNVNHLDNNRQNILFNAVILGAQNIEFIELLLKKGLKINQKDKDDRTILDELLKILSILKNEDVKVEGKYKLVKPERNYLKLTSILMDYGLAIDRADQDGKTVLFKEIQRKNFDTIEFLMAAGADVNHGDKDGKTALFDAVLGGVGNINMIDYLIEKGADIDQRDKNERTIIDDLAEIILIQNNSKKPSDRRLYDIRDSEDYVGLLKRMLTNKPKINIPKKNGRTVIYDIINHNNLELIKIILNNGCDANLRDINGDTPLSVLIDEGVKIKRPRDRELFIERLVFLLKFRVDVNSVDLDGKTVFHKAIISNDLEVVEKLLTKKADLNIKDKQGRTALHHTQWKGNYRIARLLISAGADMNEVDYAGFSILNYAAILGHVNLVVVLIASGVLMYNRNKKSAAIKNFFIEREKNLDKLLQGNITDQKMRNSIQQVITNLKKEIHE